MTNETTTTVDGPARDDSAVLELRDYTLHPGRRDDLIALFERAFIESQEATGVRVLGTFRDLDRPDHFVWLRGFPDMAARKASLDAFYTGAVWQQHRSAANATMIDSDDVLLLRPVDGAGLPLAAPSRAPVGAVAPPSVVVATTYLFAAPVDDDFRRWFARTVLPLALAAGAGPIARLETEPARNDYPRLPVREGVHAFVWLASFASDADHARYQDALHAQPAWGAVEAVLRARLAAPPAEFRLAPTARSLVRHPPADLPTGDVHDFDFLAGTWRVHNRALVARGVGCTEWKEYIGTSRVALHLGGVANVDEIELRGWSGLTVRTFDVAQRRWSIYWIDSRTGALGTPVHGGFTGDRGTFFGDDVHDGRPVRVRFHWDRLGPDRARWEQAFSFDGLPWEVNWTMDFARTSRATGE